MSHCFFSKFSLLLLLYFASTCLKCFDRDFYFLFSFFFNEFLLLCFECGLFVCLFAFLFVSFSKSLIFGLNFCGRFSSDEHIDACWMLE